MHARPKDLEPFVFYLSNEVYCRHGHGDFFSWYVIPKNPVKYELLDQFAEIGSCAHNGSGTVSKGIV